VETRHRENLEELPESDWKKAGRVGQGQAGWLAPPGGRSTSQAAPGPAGLQLWQAVQTVASASLRFSRAAARSVRVRTSRKNGGRQEAQVSRGAKMGSDAEQGRAEGSWLVADLRRRRR
jgi:hypothetical protein